MAEFIRIGSRRVNANDVHGIDINADGTLSVDLKGQPYTLEGDEASTFLEWLDSATLNPAPPPVSVPDVAGQTASDVGRTLEQAGLCASFSGDSDGMATAQDPAAGAEVPKGSTVTVTLAVAPPEEQARPPGITGGTMQTPQSEAPAQPTPSPEEPKSDQPPGSPAVLVDEPKSMTPEQEEHSTGRHRGRRDRG
jgi:beta-lactam-binding protein with PASTA domain